MYFTRKAIPVLEEKGRRLDSEFFDGEPTKTSCEVELAIVTYFERDDKTMTEKTVVVEVAHDRRTSDAVFGDYSSSRVLSYRRYAVDWKDVRRHLTRMSRKESAAITNSIKKAAKS